MSDIPTFEIEVDADDARHLEPWSLQNVTMTTYEWRKTYVQIIDYGADGTLDDSTRQTYRVRAKDGPRLTLCRPEDDDEPNVFPGTYWRTDEDEA